MTFKGNKVHLERFCSANPDYANLRPPYPEKKKPISDIKLIGIQFFNSILVGVAGVETVLLLTGNLIIINCRICRT
jgi:hypothetical protein